MANPERSVIDTPEHRMYDQVREHWHDLEMPWPLERLRELLQLTDRLPDGTWQTVPATTRIADIRAVLTEFDETAAATSRELGRLSQENQRLRELGGDVLRAFTERGRPGYEARRTHWVPAPAVQRWREILAELSPPQIDITAADAAGLVDCCCRDGQMCAACGTGRHHQCPDNPEQEIHAPAPGFPVDNEAYSDTSRPPDTIRHTAEDP